MNRKSKILFLFVALVFVAACAGVQTQEGAYYEALGIWYDTGLQFKRYYEAADPDTQAIWDAELRPLLIQAKEVLDIWYVHLSDGEPTDGDAATWKALKNDILFYMANKMKEKA